MDRYQKHINLSEIGLEGQAKLKAAKVLVIGAGGLGCPVLQYLTAAGVGTIGIVDHDTIELSNLQRQILYATDSIGRKKAEVAKEVLAKLNPTIEIKAFCEAFQTTNCSQLVEGYDLLIDTTDNFTTRYLSNDVSLVHNIPLVYGAIYKFEGQVSVFNYQSGPSYRCLFPSPPKAGSTPNCEQLGVLGVLPGIIGCLQANEALKLILGIGEVLSGKLYCYNALSNKTSVIKINPNKNQIEKILERGLDFQLIKEQDFCVSKSEISIGELEDTSLQFIDVRELDEQPRLNSSSILEIPLSSMESQIESLPKDKKTIVFCKTNIRSKQAVSILKQHHFTNCFSLKEGALELQQYLTTNKK